MPDQRSRESQESDALRPTDPTSVAPSSPTPGGRSHRSAKMGAVANHRFSSCDTQNTTSMSLSVKTSPNDDFFLKRSMDRRTAARQGENNRKTRRITRIQPMTTKIIPKSRRRRGQTDRETTIYASEGRNRLYAQPLRGTGREWRRCTVLDVSTPEHAHRIAMVGRAHVARMERRRHTITSGKLSHDVTFCVTSLTAAQADAAHILELVRSHWTMDNR